LIYPHARRHLLSEGVLLDGRSGPSRWALADAVPGASLGSSLTSGSWGTSSTPGAPDLALGVDGDTQRGPGPEEAEDGEDVDNELEDRQACYPSQVNRWHTSTVTFQS